MRRHLLSTIAFTTFIASSASAQMPVYNNNQRPLGHSVGISVGHNCYRDAWNGNDAYCPRDLNALDFWRLKQFADAVRLPHNIAGYYKQQNLAYQWFRNQADVAVFPTVFAGKMIYEPQCAGNGLYCAGRPHVRRYDMSTLPAGNNTYSFRSLMTTMLPHTWALEVVADGAHPKVFATHHSLAHVAAAPAALQAADKALFREHAQWGYMPASGCKRRSERNVPAGPIWHSVNALTIDTTFNRFAKRAETLQFQWQGFNWVRQPFYVTEWYGINATVDGVTCLAIDPSKAAAADMLGGSIAQEVAALGVDGLVTDEIGGKYVDSNALRRDIYGRIDNPARLNDDGTRKYITKTIAVPAPWDVNVDADGDGNADGVAFLLSHGTPLESYNHRLPFDDDPQPMRAYSQAAVAMSSELASDLRLGLMPDRPYMPNFNTIAANLLELPGNDGAKFDAVDDIFSQGAYFEKWGNVRTGGDAALLRTYLELYAARIQADSSHTAVLTAQLLSYNDTDVAFSNEASPFPGLRHSTHNLERALAMYLLVMNDQNRTLAIEPERFGNNTGPDNYRSARVTANILAHDTWLRELLDLKAGNALMPVAFDAKLNGHANHHLVYRQFDNALVIFNTHDEALKVTLPDIPGPRSLYYYVRMQPFSGNATSSGTKKDGYAFLGLPLSQDIDARIDSVQLNTCLASVINNPNDGAQRQLDCETTYGQTPSHTEKIVEIDRHPEGSDIIVKAGQSVILYTWPALRFGHFAGYVNWRFDKYLKNCTSRPHPFGACAANGNVANPNNAIALPIAGGVDFMTRFRPAP